MKKTNILVIKGIFPADVKARMIAIASVAEDKQKCIFSNLPQNFEGFDTWPQTTKLHCWNCDRQNLSVPLFVPLDPYINAQGKLCCSPHGHFDTWNCAMVYAYEQFPPDRKWDLHKSIYIFARAQTGLDIKKIAPSPPKTLMQKYRGSTGLTPQEYSELIKKNNNLSAESHITNSIE